MTSQKVVFGFFFPFRIAQNEVFAKKRILEAAKNVVTKDSSHLHATNTIRCQFHQRSISARLAEVVRESLYNSIFCYLQTTKWSADQKCLGTTGVESKIFTF